MFNARSGIAVVIVFTCLALLSVACAPQKPIISPVPTTTSAINITEKETTYGEITQRKAFNQCNSTSSLKAEVHFSESSAQEAQQELVLKAGVSGEAGISALAKLKIEGALEQHFSFSQTDIAEHQESVTLEVPPNTYQEYTLTWRETRR